MGTHKMIVSSPPLEMGQESWGVLPLSVVDNSAFSPNCLTILLDPVYTSL
jgi:hypothetical protein